MEIVSLILIGGVAGVLSGFLGIGGATIIIPSLIYFFKMNQHLAQGTSIAVLLLPIGILAAMRYYQAGNVDIRFAVFLALGFVFGGYFGANFAHLASAELLRKIFAVYLIVIAVQLLFFTK
ncbi:MAG: sulfite exporter TauE/SafE family protein [Candidatus Margulisiibacteriota bacterium]|jgi:hypothetical protein